MIHSLSETIHSLGKKCINDHSSSDQMARLASESLELSKVNSSKICSTRVFSTSDHKVNKLSDFVFA